RRRHTRFSRDWSSDVCSSDLPLLVLSFTMKGTLGDGKTPGTEEKAPPTANLMLAVGVSALISVPVFKTLTHLPPYLGMMLGLSRSEERRVGKEGGSGSGPVCC